MGWKQSLPDDLFYLSQNGLVIPRYISKPVFSFTLLASILVVIVIIFLTTPYFGGSRIALPESAHTQFQFMDDRTSGNFLVTVYMRKDSTIRINDVSIDNPDSPALPGELSSLFRDKAAWRKQMRVPFLQKSHYFNMGYVENSHKLFLNADMMVPWGKVISLLKAARKAGVRNVCFLTEERLESCD